MKNLYHFSKKLKQISCYLRAGSAWLHHSFRSFLSCLIQLNPFWLETGYFITLSLLGFLVLKASKRRTSITPFFIKDIDLFFTSASAVTVSSMSTVEMEVFSNTQLVFLTILIFVGGEVFTSMLGLHLMNAKMINHKRQLHKIESCSTESSDSNDTRIELGMINRFETENTKPEAEEQPISETEVSIKLNSIKTLAYLVSCYLLVVHATGSTLISIYLSLIPSARKILKTKQISLQTFSIFTTVSTFSNCGFIPTKENMVVFKKDSGLLLIMIPQILMGNTLYPVFLRSSIWFMERMTKRAEFSYLLKNSRELGYGHLLSGLHCVYLAITVIGFVMLQLIVFCSLEWNSEAINNGGMNGYQKLVGSLFQVVNSRHAGESVFDLSAISPAILVVFVFMMYLPPYTSYLPIIDEAGENISTSNEEGKETRKRKGLCEQIRFSQLTYLLIFVIVICITERQKMKNDPLNFNVLNIILEVVSAYGNVGFSVGYSCERQIKPDGLCKDSWSGFAGSWSNAGKFVLIVVMFFGRLKKFSKRGGRAWILA